LADNPCYLSGIGEKVGFYFSVQSGGSFDIDYTVQDPNEKVILEGQAERQGDYIFTANIVSSILQPQDILEFMPGIDTLFCLSGWRILFLL
jgi:hypothetical protein